MKNCLAQDLAQDLILVSREMYLLRYLVFVICMYIYRLHEALHYWPDAPLGQSGLRNHFFPPPPSSSSHTIAYIFQTVQPILTKLCMNIPLMCPHFFHSGFIRIRQR